VRLAPLEELSQLDAVVLAVCHRWYLDLGPQRLFGMVRDGGVVVDVKSALDPSSPALGPRKIRYWSL
jgi:UDP-N-acetyl-D-galactosamine dehydrogenase